MSEVTVVIPNWNGKDSLAACLDSLMAQTYKADVLVVDNGSADGSVEFIQKNYPSVKLIIHQKNLGFAGGVNSGIKKSIENSAKFVALFNNDAVAGKDWLKHLVETLEKNSRVGIVTGKLLSTDGKSIDSSGDQYTVWGLPYPRGRSETNLDKYDNQTEIFAATGGASLYRIKMLDQIGLFDEDFFAYYEDVDLSFRAQLAGWKVLYVPNAIAYHQIGATSGKIKGFTTYQTLKNYPWLFWKNVPIRYLFRIGWRFKFAYLGIFISAITRGQIRPAFKGLFVSLLLAPKKIVQRWQIQRHKSVSNEYIWGIITHDLPPIAGGLRALRAWWWKLTRRQS